MNVSISELLLIAVIALLVIKPDRLPEVALTLGRFMKAVRHIVTNIKKEMTGLVDGVEKPNEQRD